MRNVKCNESNDSENQTWAFRGERRPLAALSVRERRDVGVGLDAVRWPTAAPHACTRSAVLTGSVSNARQWALCAITACQRQLAQRLT